MSKGRTCEPVQKIDTEYTNNMLECAPCSRILSYSMKQSPSWEANRFSANQEIPPHFMEPGGPLPHSQVPATCPYPRSRI